MNEQKARNINASKMSNHLTNWTLLKLIVIFYTICNCNSHIRPLYEELQINRSIAEYFQIEEKLWAAIQRREENTLELIYQQHKIRLNDNQFQNIIERNRIGVDLELTSGLRFINDTTTNVFNIIKSRDYGGLIRFSGSYQVKNITDAMDKISRASVSADLWRDLSDVRWILVFILKILLPLVRLFEFIFCLAGCANLQAALHHELSIRAPAVGRSL